MASKNIGLRRLNAEQNRVITVTQLLFFFTGLLLFLFGIVRITLEFGETLTGVNNDALKSGVADWFTGETYTTPIVFVVGIATTMVGYGLLWAVVALGAKERPAWSAGYGGLITTLAALLLIGGLLVWLDVPYLPVFVVMLALLVIGCVLLLMRFNQADFRLVLGAERINRQGIPTYVWVIYGAIVVGVSILSVLGLVYAVLTDVIELDLSDVPEGELIYLTSFDGFNDEWDIENATDNYTSAMIEPDENSDTRLVMTLTPEAGQGVFTLLDRTVRNFDLRVTTTQLDSDPFHDNAFGVIFGYRDDDTYYQFQISGDGYYRLVKVQPNTDDDSDADVIATEISPWHLTTNTNDDLLVNGSYPTLIRPGRYNPIDDALDTRNEIRIVVRDQKISFFINGEPMPLCLKGSRGSGMWVGDGCVEGNIFTYTFEDEDYRQGQIGVFVDRTATSDASYPVSIAFDNIVIVGPPDQLDIPTLGEEPLP